MSYRKIPELHWLKDTAEAMMEKADETIEYETGKKLMDLYKYLLWSRRYQLSPPQEVEHDIAFGLMLKYCRRLYPGTTPYEAAQIKKAQALFRSVKTGHAVSVKSGTSISSKKRSIK